MPFPPKKSIQAFAKKTATPPLAASMLAKKRAAAPPAPAVAPPAVPVAAAPPGAPPVAVPPVAAAPAPVPAAAPAPEEQVMNMSEMLEEAAQEAEAMANPEIEDLIAGYTLEGDVDPMAVPAWASDPELWEHVAKTVGLDVPELSARYEEPFAVAAYLYAKMGGPLKQAEEAAAEEGGDMEKPGTAAKAMSAVMKSKPKVPAPTAAPQ